MTLNCYMLVPCILLLLGCESKVPDCASGESRRFVIQGISEQLIGIGVANINKSDLENIITIGDIQTVSYDERLDTYKCNSIFRINYPNGLANNISTSFSSEKGREDLLEKLKLKYGNFPGFITYGQLLGVVSVATMSEVFNQYMTKNKGNYGRETIQEILKVKLEAENKYIVSYEIFPIQYDEHKRNYQIKFIVENSMDEIKSFLNISNIYTP